MNTIEVAGPMSCICTCMANAVTASWDGRTYHAETCAMFVPTKEQYAEVRAERDKLREVAKAARVFLDSYDQAGGLAKTQTEAMALDHALDALSVEGCAGPVDPYWMK